MAIYRLLEGAAFGPDQIRAMTDAYENALRIFGLARTDPLTESVAKKVIEVALTGERNTQRLAALVIDQLGLTPKQT
jgi:hypothetical protein